VPAIRAITRTDIQGIIGDQLARWRPATAANRFRNLRQFFIWLVEEDEIDASPMNRMPQPRVPNPMSMAHVRRRPVCGAPAPAQDRRQTSRSVGDG